MRTLEQLCPPLVSVLKGDGIGPGPGGRKVYLRCEEEGPLRQLPTPAIVIARIAFHSFPLHRRRSELLHESPQQAAFFADQVRRDDSTPRLLRTVQAPRIPRSTPSCEREGRPRMCLFSCFLFFATSYIFYLERTLTSLARGGDLPLSLSTGPGWKPCVPPPNMSCSASLGEPFTSGLICKSFWWAYSRSEKRHWSSGPGKRARPSTTTGTLPRSCSTLGMERTTTRHRAGPSGRTTMGRGRDRDGGG